MPHPDLNNLRRRIEQEKANGSAKARKGKTKKVFLLFMVVALIGLAFVYQEAVMHYSKLAYHTSYAYVAKLFQTSDRLEDITDAGGEQPGLDSLPAQFVLVDSKGANIRSKPDIEAEVATVVRQGSRLTYEHAHDPDGEIVWLKVTTDSGETGWISDVIVHWDEEAAALLEEAAETGNAVAMRELGIRYEDGLAVEADVEQALHWYEAAAEAGEREAQFILGWFYQQGEGNVDQNYKRAFDYYQSSAVQGHGDAMNNIAYMYAYGMGVKEDGDRSRQWYEKAIEYGSRDAITNLAVLYLQGRDNLEVDVAKGVELMEEAAAAGDADAKEAIEVYQTVSEEEFLKRMRAIDQE